MTTFPLAARVAVASLSALLLAACGGTADGEDAEPNGIAEMRPAAAVALAAKTLASRDSVTFEGTIHVDGTTLPGTLTLTRANACDFTSTSDKGRLTMRLVGRTTYVQANAKALIELFDVPPEAAAPLADAWMSIPTAKKALDDCRLGQVLPTGRHRATVKAAGTKEIGGREARGFRGRDEDGPVTMWIATTGDPDVLLITNKSADGASELSLTELDTAGDITAPAKSRRIG